MKLLRLVQIFSPVKEANRRIAVLCGGFADADRAKKMRQDERLNESVIP